MSKIPRHTCLVTNRHRLFACPSVLGLITCLQFVAAPFCEATLTGWNAANNNSLWDSIEAPVGGPSTDNWSHGIPGAADDAILEDLALLNPIYTIDLNGDRSVKSVNIYGPSVFTMGTAVGGDTLTVGNGNPNGRGLDARNTNHVINCNVLMNDTVGDGRFSIYVLDGGLTIKGVVSGNNFLHLDGQRGALILDNANTYSGGTTIEEGTIRVGNAAGSGTGTGPVTVNAAGVLSGTGRVGGSITVDSGGTLAPGTSVGTLTALAGVTLNGTYACELGGASSDRLAVTGTLNVRNGTLDLTEISPLTGTSFTIATATQVQGPFAVVSGLRPGLSISYNSTSIVVERNPIHVDAAAASGGNGVSWGSALDSLDDALADAVSGDEIWVKKGIYVPGEGSTDPYSTFDVPDGVTLLGGFDGTETSASERDPSEHLTVLSGDLGGDDTGKVNGITPANAFVVGTNAYSVVTVSFAAPTIDGFTITGGKAIVHPVSGQGAESRGGGLFIDTDFARVPTIANCRFYGNTAFQGGGVFVHSWGGADFVSCDFRSNIATGRGGAAYYWWSNVTTKNCNFSGNRAGDDGGAIFDDPQDKGTSLFVNCSFSGNLAVDGGGAIANNTTGSSSAEMINTLIWNNSAQGSSAGPGASITNASTYDISHSLLANNSPPGTGNLEGTDASNAPGFFLPLEPALAPNLNGDFRAAPGSTVLNAGDNSAISGISLDLSAEPRILDTTVDIGAYEGSLYSTYTWWMNGYFPGETDPEIIGPDADPSGNGLNNALSFVTNISPLTTHPVQPIYVSGDEDTQRFILAAANSGWEEFDAFIEYSFDLENWSQISLDPDRVANTVSEVEPGIGFSQWTYFPLILTVEKATHPKIFVRLSVDIP